MKDFKSMGIQVPTKKFNGEKIKVTRILNREIEVYDWEIKPSKFTDKGNKECLFLQIKVDGQERVVFTGSGVLMGMIKQVKPENFPFKTTIIKDNNDRYEFT